MDGIEEIVQEFLVECHDNLDQVDRDLVALERDPQSRELLDSVFRTIHTIKGTSGFLAFARLELVTHTGESVLARVRDGEARVTPGVIDVLLRLVDVVRELLAAIEADGTEGAVDVEAVLERIARTWDEQAAPTGSEPGGLPSLSTAPGTLLAGPPFETVDLATLDQVVQLAVAEAATGVEEAVGVPGPGSPPSAGDIALDHLRLLPQAPSTGPDPPPTGLEPAAVSTPGPGRRQVADSSVRIDVDLLDELMRLVGELVLTRNQMLQQVGPGTDVGLADSAQRLNLIASELQEGVMRTRLQPIDHLWSKLPRVVRDLGASCGKQVSLTMEGHDTELDRSLLESIKDPITHLVRNAIDHGLERPEERLAAGKPAEGVLTLRAYHEGGQVVIEIGEDGAGIDPQLLGRMAVSRGFLAPEQVAQMSAQDLLELVFTPGFTTAMTVTSISGRGVGMDVVREKVEAIGGTIEITSVVGRGTTIRLRIPLTLAIIPVLTVQCGPDRYAIPQVNVMELVAFGAGPRAVRVEYVHGAAVCRLRDRLLPLVDLAHILDGGLPGGEPTGRPEAAHPTIVVVRADGRLFGVLVDRVLNTEEIVVKPLIAQVKALGTFSGATILGDGRVALIIDVQAIARRILVTAPTQVPGPGTDAGTRRSDETAQALVVGVGGGRRLAIPLSSVTRLERVPATSVGTVGRREVVTYRGDILPMIRLGRHLDVAGDPDDAELLVVLYSTASRSVAIVVEEIWDIVEDRPTDHTDVGADGVLGSMLVRDEIVEILDVRSAVLAADPCFFDGLDSDAGDLVGAR